MQALRAGAISLGLLLSACGVEEDLAQCLNTNEQSIVLKQLALTGERKKQLDYCLNDPAFHQTFCRGLYLDANGLIRTCMNAAGYSFIDPDFYLAHGKSPNISYYKAKQSKAKQSKAKQGMCDWSQYTDTKCYQSTWFATIKVLLN